MYNHTGQREELRSLDAKRVISQKVKIEFLPVLCCHMVDSSTLSAVYSTNSFIRHVRCQSVNLYVFHVSLTDFHCFDWLTYVRGNPYGFII